MIRNKNAKEIILNNKIDDIEYYYTDKELKERGYTIFFINRIKQYIQCYKYKKIEYYLKSDFEQLLKWESELGFVDELSIHFKFTTMHIRSIFKKHGIESLSYEQQPFTRQLRYNLKDFEKIEVAILDGVPKDIMDENKYIDLVQTADILGERKITLERLPAFDFVYRYGKKLYLKIEEVEKYKKLKEISIPVEDFIKDVVNIVDFQEDAIRDRILKSNIELIERHPFMGKRRLMLKKDAHIIFDELNMQTRIKSAKNGLEIYRILTENIKTKEKLEDTMQIYELFVIDRFNDIKSKQSSKVKAISFHRVKEILNKTLNMDFYKYSEDLVEKIIENIISNEEYTQSNKVDFVAFYNYLIKYKSLKNRIVYKLPKDSFVDESQEILGYTQEQFLELFRLLHTSTMDEEYINRAVKNRGQAQVWLYMYLHYVTIWRRGAISEIPSPNIKNIGFEAEELLKWILEGNEFTEEMGIIITEDVKRKIDGYSMKSTKNNGSLVMEVGRLTVRSLGLLFAICEAHRQITHKLNKKNLKAESIISSGFIGNKSYYDDLFGKEITNILGEEKFSNRRANKSYNNYIHNYSEEKGDNFATHIISILRGYSVDSKGMSETTTIYETRKVDNSIENAVATLFNRGSFAFEKFQTLKIIDNNFIENDDITKTELMDDISLTPYELECTMKNIYIQRKKVTEMISKMVSTPNLIKEIIVELAYGNTHGKHNHTRCILKAMLNTIEDSNIDDVIPNNLIELNEGINCINDNFDTCIGCPFIIEEMYFLYELNDLMNDAINKLDLIDNEYEQYMYSTLIFKTYMPILKEAQNVLGKSNVNVFVDVVGMKNKIDKLRERQSIKLDYKLMN